MFDTADDVRDGRAAAAEITAFAGELSDVVDAKGAFGWFDADGDGWLTEPVLVRQGTVMAQEEPARVLAGRALLKAAEEFGVAGLAWWKPRNLS